MTACTTGISTEVPTWEIGGPIAVRNIIIQYCPSGFYASTEYLNINVHDDSWGYFITGGRQRILLGKRTESLALPIITMHLEMKLF